MSLLAVSVAFGAWLAVRPRRPAGPQPLSGYIARVDALDQEYARFYGRPLKDAELRSQFRRAAERMLAKDYPTAASLLETVARQASVPVVFNDLGLLYAQLDDRARAINAFRNALAHDLMYQPVRFNLNRLKGFTADSADPVTQEIEPNNALLLANVIALGKPVEAAIAAGQGDADSYRFNAPPAPRDILLLEIANHSASLAPMVNFYDDEMRLLDWGKTVREPAAPLDLRFSPEPNAGLRLQVRGYGGSSGAYILTVRPLQLFDSYEPDDDIMSARRIALNQTVYANIMDARDTDYYSFESPVAGTVKVEIQNRSATLIPVLTTFTPDMRNSGFGPDVRKAGEGLTHEIPVLANRVYFIQVWSQSNTWGDYALTVSR